MAKKYIVRLSSEERAELSSLVNKGKAAAYKRLHAQILLKSDISESGPGWSDLKITDSFDVSISTVERLRKRLVEKGLEAALNRAKQERVRSRRLDGEQEAHLIAMTCGDPPDGYGRWTLRLLADQMVELEYTDTVSHETVRQLLKKRNKTVAENRMVYSSESKR